MNLVKIEEFEDYFICKSGKVFSGDKELKPMLSSSGYYKVHLYKDGKLHNRYIHRLVAFYFVRNYENNLYVDHIDRNKLNNDYINLRWTSAKQNTNNTAGKSRYSVNRSGFSHYSQADIKNVEELYNSGESVMSISRTLNIPRQSVSRFVKKLDNRK